MKQRIANKIEKKETETPKIKRPTTKLPKSEEHKKSEQHKKLVVSYTQDNQQKQLVFDPATQTFFYKAQSLRDTKGQPLANKVDANAQISLNTLLQLDPDGPRRTTARAGEYVNEKAQTWFTKGKTIAENAVIKDMPQGWAYTLGTDFNPAGLGPQALAQMLVAKRLAKLSEPKIEVAKEPKPKADKKPRVKKEKVARVRTPEEQEAFDVRKAANKERRAERKAEKELKGQVDFAYVAPDGPKIDDFGLYFNVALGDSAKSEIILGMQLKDDNQQPAAEIRFYGHAHMVGCQFVDYATQTSKTLIAGYAAKDIDGKVSFVKPYYQIINVGTEKVTVYDAFELDWKNLDNPPELLKEANIKPEDFVSKYTAEFLYQQMANKKLDALDNNVEKPTSTPLFARKISSPIKDAKFDTLGERFEQKEAWQTFLVAAPGFEDDSVNTSVAQFFKRTPKNGQRDVALDIGEACVDFHQGQKDNMTMFVPNQGDSDNVYSAIDLGAVSPVDHKLALAIALEFRKGIEEKVMHQKDKTGYMMALLKDSVGLTQKLFSANKINTLNSRAPSADPIHAAPEVV